MKGLGILLGISAVACTAAQAFLTPHKSSYSDKLRVSFFSDAHPKKKEFALMDIDCFHVLYNIVFGPESIQMKDDEMQKIRLFLQVYNEIIESTEVAKLNQDEEQFNRAIREELYNRNREMYDFIENLEPKVIDVDLKKAPLNLDIVELIVNMRTKVLHTSDLKINEIAEIYLCEHEELSPENKPSIIYTLLYDIFLIFDFLISKGTKNTVDFFNKGFHMRVNGEILFASNIVYFMQKEGASSSALVNGDSPQETVSGVEEPGLLELFRTKLQEDLIERRAEENIEKAKAIKKAAATKEKLDTAAVEKLNAEKKKLNADKITPDIDADKEVKKKAKDRDDFIACLRMHKFIEAAFLTIGVHVDKDNEITAIVFQFDNVPMKIGLFENQELFLQPETSFLKDYTQSADVLILCNILEEDRFKMRKLSAVLPRKLTNWVNEFYSALMVLFPEITEVEAVCDENSEYNHLLEKNTDLLEKNIDFLENTRSHFDEFYEFIFACAKEKLKNLTGFGIEGFYALSDGIIAELRNTPLIKFCYKSSFGLNDYIFTNLLFAEKSILSDNMKEAKCYFNAAHLMNDYFNRYGKKNSLNVLTTFMTTNNICTTFPKKYKEVVKEIKTHFIGEKLVTKDTEGKLLLSNVNSEVKFEVKTLNVLKRIMIHDKVSPIKVLLQKKGVEVNDEYADLDGRYLFRNCKTDKFMMPLDEKNVELLRVLRELKPVDRQPEIKVAEFFLNDSSHHSLNDMDKAISKLRWCTKTVILNYPATKLFDLKKDSNGKLSKELDYNTINTKITDSIQRIIEKMLLYRKNDIKRWNKINLIVKLRYTKKTPLDKDLIREQILAKLRKHIDPRVVEKKRELDREKETHFITEFNNEREARYKAEAEKKKKEAAGDEVNDEEAPVYIHSPWVPSSELFDPLDLIKIELDEYDIRQIDLIDNIFIR
ncbi:hypothetical protein ENBRE01_1421 [Enteropsectra breve]|nr:hypothetical protein ENBRE01_1421 [Enteropsectra breve]